MIIRGDSSWKSSIIVSPDGCRGSIYVKQITNALEVVGQLQGLDLKDRVIWKPNSGTLHLLKYGEEIPKLETVDEDLFIDWLVTGLANPRVTADMFVKGLKARNRVWPDGWKLVRNYVGGWQLYDSKGASIGVHRLVELIRAEGAQG